MTHSRVVGWAERSVIILDIFRLADSRIVEHRDVVQQEVSADDIATGHSMI